MATCETNQPTHQRVGVQQQVDGRGALAELEMAALESSPAAAAATTFFWMKRMQDE
jgi:hypothetical protein